MEPDSLVAELREARGRFLALVDDVRPDLHRYCARMTGSIADAEDIVQDTLARAYYALAELGDALPPLRPWLFRIAHNRAIDFLRGYERRMREPIDDVTEAAADGALDPEDALARDEAVRAAVTRFLALVPVQRSCLILKDVLGHSLEEIAALLELSVPAVKAALHRGRVGLREASRAADAAARPEAPPASPAVQRYALLFNARDWDGLRAMLADDVRLDLVTRSRRAGRRDVGEYFTRYAQVDGWHHLAPAWLDGREVLAVFRRPDDERPGYFIELAVVGGKVASIRDFRYVPYIARDAAIVLVGTQGP
ncbi:MAG TPA: sigma-70 family RNA polymerase sigma factor [Haliangiales bacterium]|nr:sigma-70 family RNA polymerase sigma factor [Haliangiales bacterium]